MKKFAMLVFLTLFLLPLAACQNPDSSTPATRDAPEIELDFTLQDGLNGYAGTFTQIYAQGQADAMTGRNAWLRFDLEGVKTQIQEAMDNLGDGYSLTDCTTQLVVAEAVVSVFGFSDIAGVSPAFSMVTVNAASPLFTEADSTTWTQANSTEAWSITPAGGGVDTFNDVHSGLNTYVDVPSSDFPQWLDFRLHRPHVQSWFCDQTTNKGMQLTVLGGGSTGFAFAAREFTIPARRPMMRLRIQVHPTAP